MVAGGGGAVGKGKEDDLAEAYEILGITEEADEKEIQAAYRKGSLKCHPDRNPDDPEAAEKFDRLTRAKDLLLDPAKRAELDNQRKAKRDLEERFAQEDSKRRRLREDLESREDAASRGVSFVRQQSAADLKKRAAQMDFAARIKAKQAEMAERQAEVAAEAEEARAVSEESRVRATWRAGGAPASVEVIREALKAFEVRSIEMAESGAVVMLGSREDALRAVLHCRERKHQLPFRLALAAAKKTTATDHEAGNPEKPASAAKPAASAEPPPRQQKASAGGRGAVPAPSGFGDWEAQMLSGLAGLAAAQRASKAKT
mmetsp:Transcript_39876/g.70133  ORF Transcript_39876/g.70133 Transcript_39876/m.70133 type:complete len:316 (-) Transcript_39876:101-1048(-)